MRMRASPVGSSAMRAWSCTPGPVVVIFVRFGGLGEITARSVCGVKAKGGTPGSELLAGVVAGLLVVRSGLSTQLASASLGPSWLSRFWHLVAAAASPAA